MQVAATPLFFGWNFTSLEVQLCQKVLWEVYEMGFWLELLAMDRLLCPAGGDSYNQVAQEQQRMANISQIFDQDLNICIAALPTSNWELTTEDIHE